MGSSSSSVWRVARPSRTSLAALLSSRHIVQQQQQTENTKRQTRTSPALIQATSTSTMRLLLLLLGLANFICGHILQTNLINGSYRYKANPYTETWILNEDGTGLTIAPIS